MKLIPGLLHGAGFEFRDITIDSDLLDRLDGRGEHEPMAEISRNDSVKHPHQDFATPSSQAPNGRHEASHGAQNPSLKRSATQCCPFRELMLLRSNRSPHSIVAVEAYSETTRRSGALARSSETNESSCQEEAVHELGRGVISESLIDEKENYFQT